MGHYSRLIYLNTNSIRFTATMKLFLLFLAVCLVAMVAGCEKDYECKGGCCLGIGRAKKCMSYLKLNEKCTIRHKLGLRCICRPGLTCVKTGTFTKRCKDVGV